MKNSLYVLLKALFVLILDWSFKLYGVWKMDETMHWNPQLCHYQRLEQVQKSLKIVFNKSLMRLLKTFTIIIKAMQFECKIINKRVVPREKTPVKYYNRKNLMKIIHSFFHKNINIQSTCRATFICAWTLFLMYIFNIYLFNLRL